MGTREAGKALARAAHAALAPDPRGARARPQHEYGAAPAAAQIAQTKNSRRASMPSRDNLRRGGRQFQAGVVKPFAKASSVLWFEFTGSFFGLFAFAMGFETWKRRAELRPGVILSGHAWLAPALFAVFAYFTVSSFVRAHRRSRRS